MQLVAANQAQQEAAAWDRRADTLGQMGDQLIQMGSPQQLSPPMVCNQYTAQTICH